MVATPQEPLQPSPPTSVPAGTGAPLLPPDSGSGVAGGMVAATAAPSSTDGEAGGVVAATTTGTPELTAAPATGLKLSDLRSATFWDFEEAERELGLKIVKTAHGGLNQCMNYAWLVATEELSPKDQNSRCVV